VILGPLLSRWRPLSHEAPKWMTNGLVLYHTTPDLKRSSYFLYAWLAH
jgi:hypothetical protein